MTTGYLGRTGAKVAIVGLLLLTTACQGGRPQSPGPHTSSALPMSTAASPPVVHPSPDSSLLDRLIVAPDGAMAGYTRARFGQPWKDTDHSGCDQRSDVLIRDAGSSARDEKQRCRVVAISLVDPYSGERLTELSQIQIDHVVSLGAAWRSGAAGWTDAQRELFATDERNLLAVKRTINQGKSDDPPEKFRHLIQQDSWCKVARIYVQVSGAWHLTITALTHDALVEMLATCQTFP